MFPSAAPQMSYGDRSASVFDMTATDICRGFSDDEFDPFEPMLSDDAASNQDSYQADDSFFDTIQFECDTSVPTFDCGSIVSFD